MFGFGKREKREVAVTQSSPEFLQAFGIHIAGGDGAVSLEQALGVPAVWAAINFISGTIAGLPLNAYSRDSKGNKKKARANDPVQLMLEGNARAIQTGQLTPNEARALENREPKEGGNDLLIQGATVPLSAAAPNANTNDGVTP